MRLPKERVNLAFKAVFVKILLGARGFWRLRQESCQENQILLISCHDMKAEIHPQFYPEAKLICACGNVITAGSTVPEIHVELCSKCHPFYTGKIKLIDAARRVEKFAERKQAKTDKAGKSLGKKAKSEKRAAQKAEKKARKSPTQLNEA